MNAYDIAKDLDREGKFPGHVCYGTSPLLVRAANKLRQQADRIAELEQAIKDADEWLESGEGVSLCYYAFSDSNPNSIKIIKEITG